MRGENGGISFTATCPQKQLDSMSCAIIMKNSETSSNGSNQGDDRTDAVLNLCIARKVNALLAHPF